MQAVLVMQTTPVQCLLRPFRARIVVGLPVPGRCPGLECCRPSGGARGDRGTARPQPQGDPQIVQIFAD